MSPRRRSALAARLVVDHPGSPQQNILDELRRVILDGAAPPGTPIPLGEVADLFGVSHFPVRESLKILVGEGLVTHRPNAGYLVAQLTSRELREIYVVREALESAALPNAVAQATAADRQIALDANDALAEAIRHNDPVAYHRQSRRFHLALARPSGMVRLLHMLESVWNVTEPVQPMVHVTHLHRTRLHADHVEMLDAFLRGDTARLLAAAKLHHRRLDAAIATLPTETGLLAPDTPPEDISFGQ